MDRAVPVWKNVVHTSVISAFAAASSAGPVAVEPGVEDVPDDGVVSAVPPQAASATARPTAVREVLSDLIMAGR